MVNGFEKAINFPTQNKKNVITIVLYRVLGNRKTAPACKNCV